MENQNGDQSDIRCKFINAKTGQTCNAYLGSVGPCAIVKFRRCIKCHNITEYRLIDTDADKLLQFKFVDMINKKDI